jgi:hypothetical protein
MSTERITHFRHTCALRVDDDVWCCVSWCCVLLEQNWPDELKREYMCRARWLHNVSMKADDPTALLPAVLHARVTSGLALPGVEMTTGPTEQEVQSVPALVNFVVVRAPLDIFREIMDMLPSRSNS